MLHTKEMVDYFDNISIKKLPCICTSALPCVGNIYSAKILKNGTVW